MCAISIIRYEGLASNILKSKLSKLHICIYNIIFVLEHKKWFIKSKKYAMQNYFFIGAKIVTTQGLQKYAIFPYMSQKIIATEVWLHGASRKGLEE